jgi:cullin-4
MLQNSAHFVRVRLADLAISFLSCRAQGQKELSLSLCQTAILLHFNSVQSLSYEDLKSRTRLEDVELKRNLQSLACGKVRVLTKSPKGKEVDDTDTFAVNEGFEHSQLRIKVNTIQHKETKEEQKDTSERVLSERMHLVRNQKLSLVSERNLPNFYAD